MLTATLRKGTELSSSEKGDIFLNMSLPGTKEERDSMRESLARKYGITEGTITSLIAHETMRRMKNGTGTRSGDINAAQTEGDGIDEKPTQSLQESTQNRVYAITTLFDLTEEMRENILEEFGDVIRSSATDSVYDYYLDIEAISDYYNIDPSILEQFLRNRYNWLGVKLDELKNGSVLTEVDKMNIRIYVSQGVDEKDKKSRRKEMAQKYGVSTYVIGAITAWKIDANGEKILKKDNKIDMLIVPKAEIEPALEPQQSINDSQIEQNLTITKEDEQNDSENNEGEHTSPEIEVDYIKDLVLEYNLQDNGQRGAFLQHVFDLFPDASIEDVKKVIPDFPDDTVHENLKRSGEGMGALINYNNEIKNKWRQKLKEFIDENTEKEKRKELKVLCLPGVECLEIPLYLELGFKPENIIGVESGEADPKNLKPEAVEKLREYAQILGISFELTKSCVREILTKMFQKNAAKYGVQTRLGKLDKVLETENTVFDVVSLDFLGYLSVKDIPMLENVRLNKKALVLVNYLGKREGIGGKSLVKFGEKMLMRHTLPPSLGVHVIDQVVDEKIGNREYSVPLLLEGILGASVRSSPWFSYNEGLRGGLTKKLITDEYGRLLALGEVPYVTNDIAYKDRSGNKAVKVVIGYYRKKFIEGIMRDMRKIFRKLGEDFKGTHQYLERPLSFGFYYLPFCEKLKQYKYNSPSSSGKTSSPFNTEMLLLERDEELFIQLSPYLDFFSDYLDCAIRSKGRIESGVRFNSGDRLQVYYRAGNSKVRKVIDFQVIDDLLDGTHARLHFRSTTDIGLSGKWKHEREIIR